MRSVEQVKAEVMNTIEKLNRDCKHWVENGAKPSNAPEVVFQIAKYGAENIFMVVRDYHSHYDDDDCYFKYYNNVTGETFSDSWSTRYAAPNFSTYECVTLWEAVYIGLPVNNDYIKHFREDFLSSRERKLDGVVREWSDRFMMNRPVTVTRGRKWTGSGWLVGKREQHYGYYGRSRTLAIVFDPKDNSFNECAFHFCELTDADQFKNEYNAWLRDQIAGRPDTDFLPSLYTGEYDVKGVAVDNFYPGYAERHPAPDWKSVIVASLTETMTRWANSKEGKTDEERALMIKRAVAKKLREMGMGE